MALPADFAQHVKSAADIVRVIGETVTLKRSGSNHIGLCPFHQEKTPSFSVHATRQFYYCFGCGAKGDVFRFVMEMEKVPFPEAVRRGGGKGGVGPGVRSGICAGERRRAGQFPQSRGACSERARSQRISTAPRHWRVL